MTTEIDIEYKVGDRVELAEDIHLRGKLVYDDRSSPPRDVDTIIKAGTKAKLYWYEKETGRMNILIDGVCIFAKKGQVKKSDGGE